MAAGELDEGTAERDHEQYEEEDASHVHKTPGAGAFFP